MTVDDSPPLDQTRSLALGAELARLVPGGAHTYAKGPDQYPADAAPLIVRGLGSRVWDVDGNEFVEYGGGLRSNILGHAHPVVVEAVRRQVGDGSNFIRPSLLELDAARDFLRAVPTMDMVKFAKNGSDVTSAAVKLARAVTGRDLIAVCSDQPFFSTDDWFIGTTRMPAGIPAAVAALTVGFPYGDLDGLRATFAAHPDQIAAVVLEVASGGQQPTREYLTALVDFVHSRGALVIVDEMITGFRWSLAGAHSMFGMRPDLVTFGKAIANGFAVSALTGTREVMERGGLNSDDERVFLLSTTHGAEGAGLAALRATIEVHRAEGISDRLAERGRTLREALTPVIAEAGISEHIGLHGVDCNFVFSTRDETLTPSQPYRTLFMRQLLRRGVIAPSFVVSAALADADIEVTVRAVAGAARVYAAALEAGDPTPYLGGRPVKPVFRPFA